MISNEHRAWGQNYEQTWVENGWNEGFTIGLLAHD